MKLDYKKTIKVGFAFAIIMIFWSAYDFVVPLLLERAFGLSNAMRGLIMGLDNLLSLFLLPIFGRLSDKTKSKYGRRTPFIVLGTIATVLLMVFVPISANSQLKEATALREDLVQNITVEQWETIYKNHSDMLYLSNNEIDEAEFMNIATTGLIEIKSEGMFKKTYFDKDGIELSEADSKVILEQNANYKKFCVTPQNIWLSIQVNQQITQQHKGRLIVYMIILLFVLISMATFRSPAVALMPDVTPKPLRSQANAVINLMGGLGSALALIIYTIGFFMSDTPYIGIFACIAGGMLLLLSSFLFLVKENKFVKECEQVCIDYEINNDEDAIGSKAENRTEAQLLTDSKAKKAKMTSFFLILASIFMWFMGYNAVTSSLSVYITRSLNLAPGVAAIISGVSMGFSALAFIPVGFLAVKIGRKKSVILGFILASISFILIWYLIRPGDYAQYFFGALYLIAGFGLIIANVNTFPMVVELARSEDVGKYTGYYYMATMSAQAIAPFVGGLFMDKFGDVTLFAYATVCVIVATILMALVKYGDSRPMKKSKMEMLGEAD